MSRNIELITLIITLLVFGSILDAVITSRIENQTKELTNKINELTVQLDTIEGAIQ